MAPAEPPLKSLLRNQSASRHTANVSVTTPTSSPRMRSAGKPTTTPMAVAPTAARIGAIGNGMCHDVVNPLSKKPATPASVSWASEIWPAYPVTTTSDSVIVATMKV